MSKTERNYGDLYRVVSNLQLSENEAITVFQILADIYNWCGSPWTTDDIVEEIRWQISDELKIDDPVSDEMVGEIVQRVKEHPVWTDFVPDRTTEHGAEILQSWIPDIIKEYLVEKGVKVEAAIE